MREVFLATFDLRKALSPVRRPHESSAYVSVVLALLTVIYTTMGGPAARRARFITACTDCTVQVLLALTGLTG